MKSRRLGRDHLWDRMAPPGVQPVESSRGTTQSRNCNDTQCPVAHAFSVTPPLKVASVRRLPSYNIVSESGCIRQLAANYQRIKTRAGRLCLGCVPCRRGQHCRLLGGRKN